MATERVTAVFRNYTILFNGIYTHKGEMFVTTAYVNILLAPVCCVCFLGGAGGTIHSYYLLLSQEWYTALKSSTLNGEAIQFRVSFSFSI